MAASTVTQPKYKPAGLFACSQAKANDTLQKIQTRVTPHSTPLSQITQIIDTNEVVRTLGFHLARNAIALRKASLTVEQYCGAYVQWLESGGLLQGTGVRSKDGTIQRTAPGDGLKVCSLWVCSSRNQEGLYWRSCFEEGYKTDSFPHFAESRIAQRAIYAELAKSDRAVIGELGAEYGDIAAALLSPAQTPIRGLCLLLATSGTLLQLTGAYGLCSGAEQCIKASIRENAGQRVAGRIDAFSYICARLEQAKYSSYLQFFPDLDWETFNTIAPAMLARWAYVQKIGIRRAKVAFKECEGGINAFVPQYWQYGAGLEYAENPLSCDRARENIVTTAEKYLHAQPQLDAATIAELGGLLAATGLGHAIAPITLPVKYGVAEV